MGLDTTMQLEAFKLYARSGKTWCTAMIREISRTIGGGRCGVAASTMVQTAGLQQTASRFLFDQAAQTGDATVFAQASRLADASRQNLLAAFELAAREAQARGEDTESELRAQQLAFQARLAASNP